ncbi:hypothetical protein PsYK624_163490 [Phanerochaete sordida]|uniref:Uncharacterized protein n=1 Tax=Phanerochaete sordida TaxID=48140 RepID=A0A9P3GQS2_9APHY|nr:hypothetical protein PsYK624_163490 [Phanerochaete sordida]
MTHERSLAHVRAVLWRLTLGQAGTAEAPRAAVRARPSPGFALHAPPQPCRAAAPSTRAADHGARGAAFKFTHCAPDLVKITVLSQGRARREQVPHIPSLHGAARGDQA